MKLEELLGCEITDCKCGIVHRIPTREVRLQPGSLDDLPQVVDRYFTDKPVVCAVDANTWLRPGKRRSACSAIVAGR